jgi:hypothetical protein
MLADNRPALDTGWDEYLLRSELVELRELGFVLPLTGFSDGDAWLMPRSAEGDA